MYLRETSLLDRPYALPEPGEHAAWSRVFHHHEVLVALNTHGTDSRGALVTVDAPLHPPGSSFTVRYRSDRSDDELRVPPPGEPVAVLADGGRAVVRVDLPPAGMAILA